MMLADLVETSVEMLRVEVVKPLRGSGSFYSEREAERARWGAGKVYLSELGPTENWLEQDVSLS